MESENEVLQDLKWMHHALALAEKAQSIDEVPVGALIVKDGQVIGEGWNQMISSNDPTAHAEIVALRAAAKTLNNYRLVDTTLYVTLEPCAMCVGAMVHSRIERLVYAAQEPKNGAVHSQIQLLERHAFNHHIAVESGLLAEQSSHILSTFFKNKRRLKKAIK